MTDNKKHKASRPFAASLAAATAATVALPARAWAAPVSVPKQAMEYIQMGCDGFALVLGFVGVMLIVFGLVSIARNMNDSSGMGQSSSAMQFGVAVILFIAAGIVKLAPKMLLG